MPKPLRPLLSLAYLVFKFADVKPWDTLSNFIRHPIKQNGIATSFVLLQSQCSSGDYE